MSKKRGLGRGLEALIPELKKVDENIEQITNIKLEDIKPSGENPRKSFDKEGLDSLADSIKKYGILQPLVVIDNNGKYEIVAGERRYRAAKKLKLEFVPAIIKELNKKDKDMISMVENIQREDLNPYEEALAYRNIMDEYSITQTELSELIGKSRTYIANMVRLLALDSETIKELEKGNITSSQGRALLTVSDLNKRKKYLEMLIKKEITVNEIEKKNTKRIKKQKDIFIQDLEDRLREKMGTKVNVKKSRNKWNINIEFTSDEQIENFLEIFN